MGLWECSFVTDFGLDGAIRFRGFVIVAEECHDLGAWDQAGKVKIPTLPQTAREGWGTPFIASFHDFLKSFG